MRVILAAAALLAAGAPPLPRGPGQHFPLAQQCALLAILKARAAEIPPPPRNWIEKRTTQRIVA